MPRTQGHWRLRGSVDAGGGREIIAPEAHGVSVARVHPASTSKDGGYTIDREECDANAELLVMAPEMLEDIQLLVSKFPQYMAHSLACSIHTNDAKCNCGLDQVCDKLEELRNKYM